MGFRDQAAAIPRVWSTATFPIPLHLPAYVGPCRGGIDGVVVKILLRIVCRTQPAARRYDREK
jgi:hypothetical protein